MNDFSLICDSSSCLGEAKEPTYVVQLRDEAFHEPNSHPAVSTGNESNSWSYRRW